MAIGYKSAGAGGGTETSGAQLALACPATVDANDILIAHVIWLDNTSEPTDPGGIWTRLYTTSGLGAALGTGTPTGRAYVYGAIAAGTEDGATVNFGTTGGTAGRFGRIYSFSGYVSGTIAQIFPAASFVSNPSETQVDMPTVTTRVAGAMALALIATDDNNAMAPATGETGGDWTELVADFVSTTLGAAGCSCQIQGAIPTADPGTITGGTGTVSSDETSTIGFELRPSPQLLQLDPAAALASPTAGLTKVNIERRRQAQPQHSTSGSPSPSPPPLRQQRQARHRQSRRTGRSRVWPPRQPRPGRRPQCPRTRPSSEWPRKRPPPAQHRPSRRRAM
jgi:hypothetical protein